uniref:F-box domain-containing protein n=1 Tax=Brassica campestris TaxID=3711 RepID=M4EDM7_BRACM
MSGRDRISELPESLLTQILSYLPTNQSVQTSVLSTRWKNLYLSVPGLDLNCSLIRYDADEVFLTFIDKLLEFSPESSLFKVKIKCRNTMIDGFKDRIGTLINRGTHHLDVESSIYFEDDDSLYPIPIVDMMPMNLLTSKTLVYLKLASSGLMDPGVVFMPCLRFMHLEEVKWRVHLEKLLSGRPVLEELTLSRDMDDDYAIGNEEFTVMRVRSQSLKRFSVLPLREARDYHSRVECTLEIDAPGLEHMSLGKDQFDRIVVKNLTSLLVVELDIKFFVKKVLHSEEMEEGEGLELTDVPRCVSSSLECVEIQEQLELEEGKMKATSYFLANSAVLKKLILSPTAYDPRNVAESEIWEKVNKLTKRSTRCEVIIRAIEVVVIDESSS